jgi:hypothetical protein
VTSSCLWHVYRARSMRTHILTAPSASKGALVPEKVIVPSVSASPTVSAQRALRIVNNGPWRGMLAKQGNAAGSSPPYTEAHVLTSVRAANWRMSANIFCRCWPIPAPGTRSYGKRREGVLAKKRRGSGTGTAVINTHRRGSGRVQQGFSSGRETRRSFVSDGGCSRRRRAVWRIARPVRCRHRSPSGVDRGRCDLDLCRGQLRGTAMRRTVFLSRCRRGLGRIHRRRRTLPLGRSDGGRRPLHLGQG